MSTAPQSPAATAGAQAEVEGKPSLVLPLLQFPSVAVLFLWMIVPLGMTIYFSFIRKNLLNPELTGFAGFENYRFLWEDPAFIPAIINSVILIGAVLIITVVLGTLFAVLFDREFFGKNIATLLVIAPFFVMPTVSALVWKNMMMHPVYGFIAVAMNKLGLPAIDWFSTYPLASIIIIVSWEWLPFAFLILFTSIKSLDQEQKEAAAVDGANPVQFFFYVTLSHLSRAIGVVSASDTGDLLVKIAPTMTSPLTRRASPFPFSVATNWASPIVPPAPGMLAT